MFKILILVVCFQNVQANDYILTFFNNCDSNLPVQFDLDFTEDLPQKVNLTISSPYNIGKNLQIKFWFYLITNENKRILIWYTNSNDGPCVIWKRYAGTFFTDIQTRASLIPDSCPIPRGKYRLINYQPNYSHLKMSNLPQGNILLAGNWIDKVTKRIVSCTNLEFQVR